MKELTIQKVGVSSFGKLIGTWFAFVGLIFGFIGAVSSVVAIVSNNDLSVLQDVLYSILALFVGVILVPMLWFVIGWLQGALVSVIFNVVVSGSGGLTIEVEEKAIKTTNK